MFATSILTIFMNSSSHNHFRVTKRILIYLQGTKVFEIKFDKQEDLKLIEFCDSDYGGYTYDIKSIARVLN